MTSTEEILTQIKALVSQGKKDDALSLLEQAMNAQPNNTLLMIWYAGLTPDIQKSIDLLENVLKLEPNNLAAQKGLNAQRAKLTQQVAPPSPAEVPLPQATSAVSTPSEPLSSSYVSGREIIRFAEETIWTFRGLNESIGRLMQDGKITSKDLAWASWNAQNARIRWSSAVYLRRNDIGSSVLDVSALAKVIWPFKNLNRPVISLLEEKTISMKDLAYAIANSKNKSLVEATAAIGYLLLTGRIQVLSPQTPASPKVPTPEKQEIEPEKRPEAPKNSGAKQSAPSKGSLNIVLGSGYLNQNQKILHKKASSMRRIGMILIIVAIIVSFCGLLTGSYIPMSIALAMLGIAYLIALAKEKFERQEENFAQGIQGEEALAQALSLRLDSEWTLFRNIDLPDRSGDLDAVLVGPKGIYLFEIKAYNFNCRNRNEQWEYRSFSDWKPLSKNPTQQALRNAARLNDYLKQIVGHDIWIEPRIVWAGKSKLFLDKPRVKVWYLNQPDFWMKEINNGKSLHLEQLNLIVVSLRTLCSINRS